MTSISGTLTLVKKLIKMRFCTIKIHRISSQNDPNVIYPKIIFGVIYSPTFISSLYICTSVYAWLYKLLPVKNDSVN